MNLYLDVDSVLLGKDDPASPAQCLARHAKEFLEFALAHFNCYWLTTHVKDGNARGLLSYLRRYVPDDLMPLLRKISPTHWVTLKTEALHGDFYWLDDSPLQIELNWLRGQNLRDRWLHVNVRENPDDLWRVMGILQAAIEKTRCKPQAKITIRPFAPQDQSAARSLILAGLGDHFGIADPTQTPDLDDIMSKRVKAGHVVVIAEDGQEMVGTGTLEIETAEIGRLVRMSVSSKHRRKGIGSALVKHLLDVAKGKAMSKVVIVTNNDWADAIGLYLRCGFKEDGRNDKDIFLSKQL